MDGGDLDLYQEKFITIPFIHGTAAVALPALAWAVAGSLVLGIAVA